jgi:hypothetical protein
MVCGHVAENTERHPLASLISQRRCATMFFYIYRDGGPMHEWQYRKVDLNDLPRRVEDIDLLNDAGAEGWEIVTITANHIAYLKRQVERPTRTPSRTSSRIKVSQA